jgi:hypothetical protein
VVWPCLHRVKIVDLSDGEQQHVDSSDARRTRARSWRKKKVTSWYVVVSATEYNETARGIARRAVVVVGDGELVHQCGIFHDATRKDATTSMKVLIFSHIFSYSAAVLVASREGCLHGHAD